MEEENKMQQAPNLETPYKISIPNSNIFPLRKPILELQAFLSAEHM